MFELVEQPCSKEIKLKKNLFQYGQFMTILDSL